MSDVIDLDLERFRRNPEPLSPDMINDLMASGAICRRTVALVAGLLELECLTTADMLAAARRPASDTETAASLRAEVGRYAERLETAEADRDQAHADRAAATEALAARDRRIAEVERELAEAREAHDAMFNNIRTALGLLDNAFDAIEHGHDDETDPGCARCGIQSALLQLGARLGYRIEWHEVGAKTIRRITPPATEEEASGG